MDKNTFENFLKTIIDAKVLKSNKEFVLNSALELLDDDYKKELLDGILKDFQTKTPYEKQKQAQKKYYEKNREKIIERQKNYYKTKKTG